MRILKDGEYIGHEVYFPGDVPQATIDLLKRYGFCKSKDGFYIPKESLDMFRLLAHPYEVDLLQPNIILGRDIPLKQRQDLILDMINALTKAGVMGIDTYKKKIYPFMTP